MLLVLFTQVGQTQSPGYFAVSLPWVGLQSEVQGVIGKESERRLPIQIPGQVISVQGLDFQLGEVRALVSGAPTDALVNQTGVRLRGESLEMTAQVMGIFIDQIIERVINGHRVRIRVQAQCEPFQVQFRQGNLNMTYAWKDTAEGLRIQSELFQVVIPQEMVTVGELKCQGLEGLGAEIQAAIYFAVKNPERLQNMAKFALEKRMNDFISEKWKLLQLGTQYRVQKYGILFFRNFDFPAEFDSEILRYQIDEKDVEPRVVMTEKNLNHIILQRIQQFSKQKVSLNEVSAFQRILRSRFLQFFLWPDLLNFSKSARFEIESSALQNLTLHKTAGGYDVGGIVLSTVRGERRKVLRDYLKLSSRIRASVDSQISGGRLVLNVHDVQSEMSWKFASDYEEEFSPSTHISSTIRNKINESIMTDRQFTVGLPVTEVGGRQWKMKSMFHRDQFVEILLED